LSRHVYTREDGVLAGLLLPGLNGGAVVCRHAGTCQVK
jgi:hypothetical protein